MWHFFHQETSEIRQQSDFVFVPVGPPPPAFSLYPWRAIISVTVDLFSSFPQKDSITGMVKEFFVPECTTLTQAQDNDNLKHKITCCFHPTVITYILLKLTNNQSRKKIGKAVQQLKKISSSFWKEAYNRGNFWHSIWEQVITVHLPLDFSQIVVHDIGHSCCQLPLNVTHLVAVNVGDHHCVGIIWILGLSH